MENRNHILIINFITMNYVQKEQEINVRFEKVKGLAEQKQRELDELVVEISKIQGEYRLLKELKEEADKEENLG